MADDLFTGRWQLYAAQNRYEFGDAPQTGKYIIESRNNGYLVTMQWTNSAGQEFEMNYVATPDGNEYPADAPGVDSMSMTRIDETTLDSAAFIAGKMIAYARRVLSADGNTMTITQSGKTPNGDDFANVSVYIRQTE